MTNHYFKTYHITSKQQETAREIMRMYLKQTPVAEMIKRLEGLK